MLLQRYFGKHMFLLEDLFDFGIVLSLFQFTNANGETITLSLNNCMITVL